MHTTRRARITIVSLLCGAACAVSAETLPPAKEANGKPAVPEAITLRLDLRLRYTYIEQSNKPDKVDVTTVRVAPGFDAKLSRELTLTAEFIHTDYIGPKRFADDPAAPSRYPLLPDPRYTGLNQATLAWVPNDDVELVAGRQALKIGNERHVSDNNFRQIPQLFDGALVRWIPFDRGALQAGYFPQLRSIFGPVQQARLAVVAFAFNPRNDVSTSLYAFRHQPEASDGNLFQYGVRDYSNATFGGTADATFTAGQVRATLTGELARQRAISGGSPLVAASYYRFGVGATLAGLTLRADHENRQSNNGQYAFQTVLSDYYAYNGNSLVFLATPKDGLRDTWLTLRYERGPFSMLHEYRWFRSDVGGKNYGRELDLNFTYKWTPQWYSRAQWARYRPELPGAVDVDKVWITLGYLLR
jgi:hypothetical protein